MRLCIVQCLFRGIDHEQLPLILQSAFRTGNAQKIAEDDNLDSVPAQCNGVVDETRAGDADRAAGTGQQSKSLRQERAQTELRNGKAVASANLHQVHGPADGLHRFFQCPAPECRRRIHVCRLRFNSSRMRRFSSAASGEIFSMAYPA